ncbi:hypothetical protein [Streptomyces sp. NPDC002205]
MDCQRILQALADRVRLHQGPLTCRIIAQEIIASALLMRRSQSLR